MGARSLAATRVLNVLFVTQRVMRDASGSVVSCSSAELTRSALVGELTDCATAAAHRGAGLVTRLLRALLADLRAMGYTGAWSLARAGEIGMNIAFAQLGFRFCGRMMQSCRIGDGMEDMNVWLCNFALAPNYALSAGVHSHLHSLAAGSQSALRSKL